MNDLTTLEQILVLIAPPVANICGIIVAIFKLLKNLKRDKGETQNIISAEMSKLDKAYDDISLLKTKVGSIEKYLLEKKK